VSVSEASSRKWLILAVVTLAAFVSNVDATIVVIGLPHLMSGLHTSVTLGLWTLTAYIITSTVFLLPAGRWTDVAGPKRVFIGGLTVFALATAACGAATSGPMLVALRFVQGGGASLCLASGTPIIVATFPREQLGRALGVNSTAWVMGSIVGPVAGGALVGTLGWRSIFYVTVPFVLLAIVGGVAVLPAGVRRGARVPTDWAGVLSSGLALVALLVALSEGPGWGWGSWRIVGLLGAAAALFAAFVVVEQRVDEPLFDLHLFRHVHFRAGVSVVVCYAIGFFATTFLLTFYLQGALHMSPLDAGLALVPLSAPQLVLSPLGGGLADRLGPARLVVAGVCLLVASAFLLGRLGVTFSAVAVVVPLLMMSAANALAWPALTKAVMSSVPRAQSGVAAGTFYALRNVGMSLSLTLALVVAESSLPRSIASQVFVGTAHVLSQRDAAALVHATDNGFTVFVAFYAAALLLALGLFRRVRERPVPVPDGVEEAAV